MKTWILAVLLMTVSFFVGMAAEHSRQAGMEDEALKYRILFNLCMEERGLPTIPPVPPAPKVRRKVQALKKAV